MILCNLVQVIVADTDNDALRGIDLESGVVRTLCDRLEGPFSVTVDGCGDLVTAEFDMNRVVVVANRLHVLKVWLMLHGKHWPVEIRKMMYNTRRL